MAERYGKEKTCKFVVFYSFRFRFVLQSGKNKIKIEERACVTKSCENNLIETHLATGRGVARGLGDGTGDTLLLLGLSECSEPVD